MVSSSSFVLSAVVVLALFSVAASYTQCTYDNDCYWDKDPRFETIENVSSRGECCNYCKQRSDCNRWSYITEKRECYLTSPWIEDWKHKGKWGCGCGRVERFREVAGVNGEALSEEQLLVENVSSARKFGKL
ncbi:hypothetical protein BSKO_02514 [Bryopsis sp. KO-2023]|nr:hypothetical protein BSKO_02514 [Bryopsis sp. KO-2023]